MPRIHSQDAGLVELRAPDAAAVVVEALAVAVRLGFLHRAALTRVLACRAIRSNGLAELRNARGLRASADGVQRHLVDGHLVHALEDVDFTASGPVLTHSPKGRPYGAAEGEVQRVEEEDTANGKEVVRDDLDLLCVSEVLGDARLRSSCLPSYA